MAYSITSGFILCYFFVGYGILEAGIVVASFIRKRTLKPAKELMRFCFVFYIVFLLSLTVLPILIPPVGEPHSEWNLNPMNLLSVFEGRWELINAAGNVMLFAPVVMLGMLNHYRIFNKLRNAVAFSLLFSVMIELIQLAESSFGFLAPSEIAVADINDVILNTIGGAAGWLCIKFYKKNDETAAQGTGTV